MYFQKKLLTGVISLFFVFAAQAEEHTLSESDIKSALKTILSEDPDIILDIIRENPAIVYEAVELVQKEEEAQQQLARAANIETQLPILQEAIDAPIIGNPEGDVTIVEFLDYNCPYCKELHKALKEIIATDPGVRIVVREFPILGAGSASAAQAALAAIKQGKYSEIHDALMESKRIETEGDVIRIARDLGLDIKKLKTDMNSDDVESHIANTFGYAGIFAVNATPALFLGAEYVEKALSVDELKTYIAKIREEK